MGPETSFRRRRTSRQLAQHDNQRRCNCGKDLPPTPTRRRHRRPNRLRLLVRRFRQWVRGLRLQARQWLLPTVPPGRVALAVVAARSSLADGRGASCDKGRAGLDSAGAAVSGAVSMVGTTGGGWMSGWGFRLRYLTLGVKPESRAVRVAFREWHLGLRLRCPSRTHKMIGSAFRAILPTFITLNRFP